MRAEIERRIEQIKNGEIPNGYTATKAGVLPKWDCVRLNQIAEPITKIVGNGTYETLSISAGIGFVNQAKKFGKELSGKQYEKYTVLNRGDFSYNKGNSKSYPQGCIYRLRDRETAAVPNVFESFKIKKDSPDYYEQLFTSGYLNKQLSKKINHGVRDNGLLNLTEKDFYSCYVPHPPIAEQQKIAEILMQCDKVIELKQKRIEEEKKLLKYLMKIMLSPNFDAKSDESPLGWRKCHLEDVCDIATGDKDVQNKVEDGKYPFFIRSEKVERIDTFSYDGEAILIPGDGKIGEVFHYINGKFDFHQRVYKISDFNKDCSGKFVYYYLKLNFKKRAMTMTAKATVDSLRRDMLTRMEVSLPDIEYQKKIVEVLDTQNSIIEKHEQELKRWQEKKKSLMQLLLTGVIRAK